MATAPILFHLKAAVPTIQETHRIKSQVSIEPSAVWIRSESIPSESSIMIPDGSHGASSMVNGLVCHTKVRCSSRDGKRRYHKMVAINPTTVSQRIIMPHVVQTSDGKRSKKGLILTLIATSIFFSMISVNMEPDPDDLDYCENYV